MPLGATQRSWLASGVKAPSRRRPTGPSHCTTAPSAAQRRTMAWKAGSLAVKNCGTAGAQLMSRLLHCTLPGRRWLRPPPTCLCCVVKHQARRCALEAAICRGPGCKAASHAMLAWRGSEDGTATIVGCPTAADRVAALASAHRRRHTPTGLTSVKHHGAQPMRVGQLMGAHQPRQPPANDGSNGVGRERSAKGHLALRRRARFALAKAPPPAAARHSDAA